MSSFRWAAQVEALEARRLLSLAAFTPDRIISDHGYSEWPGVAAGKNGQFAIIRNFETSIEDPNDEAVLVSRYSSTGAQLGPTLTLISKQPRLERPAIAMDADGNVVVVYGNEAGLYFQQISKDGKLSPRAAVGMVGNRYPSVSIGSDGGFYIAALKNLNVTIRAFDASGKPRGKAFDVYSGRDDRHGASQNLKIVAKADGSALIAFSDDANGGHVVPVNASGYFKTVKTTPGILDFAVSTSGKLLVPYNIYVPDYDPNSDGPDLSYNERFVSDVRLAPDVPEVLDDSAGSVEALPDGGFVSLFSGLKGTYVVRYRADGKQDSPSVPFSIGSDSDMAAAGDGTIVVVWAQNGNVLHYRRLTTNHAQIDGSELYVLGSARAELLAVKQFGNKIIATRSKTDLSFDASLINKITINGFGEDDQIVNTTHLRASIQGGDGNDRITSAASISLNIEGGIGDDQITVADNATAALYGGKGNDSLVGGAGRQLFDGQSGDDTIVGGAGDDRIDGGDGNDRLFGGLGNDRMNGGAGIDYIDSGKDNDTIYAKDNQTDTIFGGSGDDSATVDKNVDLLDGIETAA